MMKNKKIFALEKNLASFLFKNWLIAGAFAVLFSASAFAQNNSFETSETLEKSANEVVSDGCTWFPDGNYADCCVQHDKEYHAGGSWRQRWRSDKKLFLCIAAKPKFYNKLVAPIAWLGVRVGGVSWLNAKFSWGFGKRKTPLQKKKPAPVKNTNQTKNK